ncbi:MAG: DUF4012 domain-containing protein [Candidatus Magasanikbacteria bacterium]|nr:DUF4012 domain-containing protein [Candidatus Magasanikbacteria bacterium]
MYKKIKIILLVGVGAVLLLVAGAVGYGFWFFKQAALPEGLVSRAVQGITDDKASAEAFAHSFLGFDRPKTYLILFLNNTEIRPGGGFIGAYAVMTMNRGRPTLVKLEGTELLDNSAKRERLPLPPAVLEQYLKVSRWYFRDSNWSPDFASSSAFGLEVYSLEQGTLANKIDSVIGFTPTVMEEFLRLTGPVKFGDLEFNATNFTERLEYEVEKGYARKGKTTSERKDIIRELAKAMISKLKFDIWLNYSTYLRLAKRMLAEKQIVFYSPHPETQAAIEQANWGGRVKATNGDYLLWADANLGALKTDHAIVRSLNYQVFRTTTGFLAQTTMVFEHTQERDWRTSIYRDYARVFVPRGSRILSVSSDQLFSNQRATTTYDFGQESGKTWFGAYFTVDYKSKRAITFTYILPTSTVWGGAEGKEYDLLVQKQIGTKAVPLTVALKFDKAVVASRPPANFPGQKINEYKVATDLSQDRMFNLRVE